MVTKRRLIGPVIVGAFFAFPAAAQDLFFYPAQGQTQEQMNFDRFECHQWAVQQTGFDPMSAQATTVPPAGQPTQEVTASPLRGAAGGAAGGALIGAIAGDAGRGAAIGAVGGGLVGGMRRSDQRSQRDAQQQAINQQQAQQQAAIAGQRDNYNRALSGCMQGRGYTVS